MNSNKVNATCITNAFSRFRSCIVLQLHEPNTWWYIRSIGACSRRPWLAPSPPSPEGLEGLGVLSGLAIFHTICFSGQNICTNVTSNSGCNQRRLRSLWLAWRGPKRKAADITRTQYEIYLFSTKHNLFEAAVD